MEDEIRPKALMVPFDKFVVLDLLPPEQYKTVFSGMRWYVEQGREPEDLVPLEKMAFETLRPFLDENIKTYQRKVQTQRENGARGGRPRKPSETHGFSAKPNETHKNQSTKVKVQSTKDKVQSSSRENDCVLTTTTERIVREFESRVCKLSDLGQAELEGYVQRLGPELVQTILTKCMDLGGHSWAYARRALAEAETQGCKSVEEYQLTHPVGAGRNRRVDRKQPSGQDFLGTAALDTSLRRLKKAVGARPEAPETS